MGKEIKEGFALEVVSVRLVRDAPILSEEEIKTPEDAVRLVGQELCDMDREVVCVINLRADRMPINCHFASVGALDYSMAHPRELLKTGILSNAAKQVCGLVGIGLVDHVIVGGDNSRYFSFHEKGLVKNPQKEYQTDYRRLEWDSPAEVAERGGRR